MAKDSKGHGSDTRGGMTHAEHFAAGQAAQKQWIGHVKAGNGRAAADALAKSKAHMDNALHLLRSDKRRAAGVTPAQKMGRAVPARQRS
jgi:hypothetical protein